MDAPQQAPLGWMYDGVMLGAVHQYTCIDKNNPLFTATICLHTGETVEAAIARAAVRFGIKPLVVQAHRTFTKGLEPAR